MTLTQIADHLNNSIVPAIMGENFTISPNLANIVDMGTMIKNMTPDQFKDYLNKFVSGVARTIIDTRSYNPDNIPIRKDSQEYGGLLQSIKCDMPEASTSSIYSLNSSTTYDKDLHYFGTDFSNKIFEKDVTWEVVRSIPKTMYKKSFTTAEGVTQLVSLIENSVARKLNLMENAMVHNLLSMVAMYGVRINLVTAYNTEINSTTASIVTGEGASWTDGDTTTTGVFEKPTPVTSSNCLYNKHFVKWAKKTIANVLSNAKFMNTKYNDGTIETFMTSDEIMPVFNEVATNTMEYTLNENFDTVFQGTVYKTPFWNKMSVSVIPDFNVSTSVVHNDGTDITNLSASDNATLNYVLGVVFSKNAVGYTTTPIPVRTAYNTQGDFYNPYIDANVRYYLDTRDTMITFVLA